MMIDKTFRILIADPIHQDGRLLFTAHPGFAVDIATQADETALCQQIGDYDGLIVRSKTKATRAVISSGARLKVIGRAGIGVDNIDVAAATENGTVVFNAPDASAITTAELAIAHLFSLSRHLPQADASIRAGDWKPGNFIGTELTGKSVGIIGFGTIGKQFASRCLGLQMKVMAYDPYLSPSDMDAVGVTPVDLDALFKTADFVSLHCPLMRDTRHIINADRLAMMKPGARLINGARGGLVDEAALFEALKSGHLAGAALDVFETEPLGGSPLLALENVVVSPHLGAATQEAQRAVSVEIASSLIAFLSRGTLTHAINPPLAAP